MATGIDLITISKLNGIPYGTLVRWAHEKQWKPIRPASRRLGLRALYDLSTVAAAVAERQEREEAERAAA